MLAPRTALGNMSQYQMDLQGQAEGYGRPLSPADSANSTSCLTRATTALSDQCSAWELPSASCLGKPACFGRLPLSSGVPESCYQQFEKLCVFTLWWLSVSDRAHCLAYLAGTSCSQNSLTVPDAAQSLCWHGQLAMCQR